MRFFPLAFVRAAAARTAARAATALAAAAALAGCSFFTGIPDVDRVEVSVAPRTIGVNQQAIAVGTAFDGNSVVRHAKRQVTFRSNNPSVASINPTTGLILGLSVGTAEIVGEAGGKRDVDTVIVRLPQARSVLITNRAPVFRVGATNGIGAVARDSNGVPIDRVPVWKSTDETVLTVVGGVVTPRAVGTAQIIATVDNGANGIGLRADTVTATVTLTPVASVRVTPVNPTIYTGQTTQLTAAVVDSLQATVTRRVVWRVSTFGFPAGSVVAIDSTTGFVTAVGPGSATVSAVVDCIPGAVVPQECGGSTSITVLAPTASVRVISGGATVTTLSLRTGAAAAVFFNPLDVLGNALSGRTFRLTSSNAAVVAVPDVPQPSNYTVTAGTTTGTATITVQTLDVNGAAQGTSTTFTVTVTP